MAVANGTDCVLALLNNTAGTGTTYKVIALGTADNFQLSSKDEEITTKQSGRFGEYLIVQHDATFDVSFNYDGGTNATYYDNKALMDLQLAGTAMVAKFGKATLIGVECSVLITSFSLDAPANGKVSGKISLKSTGTITTTATTKA